MNDALRNMSGAVRRACEVLDVRADDPEAVVKRKYRQLIRKYHPDQQEGEEPASEKAVRMVTEAYAVLCRYRKEASENPVRKAAGTVKESRLSVNPEAYCSRTVYAWHDLFEEDGIVERAYGPYFWDPDEEEFLLYLRSIRGAAEQILSGGRFRMDDAGKLRLFHLLAQEFIRPLDCLRKAETVTEEDPDRGIYLTEGRVRAKDASGAIPGAGPAEPMPCILRGTRILAVLPFGEPAPLSFEEDCLYYILSMMMARDAARVTAFTDAAGSADGRLRVLVNITDRRKAMEPGRGGKLIGELCKKAERRVK